MTTSHDQIRQHIFEHLGMSRPQSLPDLATLRQTERSPSFERARSNRKVLGVFRYGPLGGSKKSRFDRTHDMLLRLQKYRRDGNAEHLVDIANQAECEFIEGRHNGLKPEDDSEHMSRKQ